MIFSLLADRWPGERRDFDRVRLWLDQVAPGKLFQLVAAIEHHVSNHLQTPILRRYLLLFRTLMARPPEPEHLTAVLDDAIASIHAFDPTDRQ